MFTDKGCSYEEIRINTIRKLNKECVSAQTRLVKIEEKAGINCELRYIWLSGKKTNLIVYSMSWCILLHGVEAKYSSVQAGNILA